MARELPLLDVVGFPLDEWLKLTLMPEHKRRQKFADYHFPTDGHRDEYLARVHTVPEQEVKTLLRRFLISSGGLGKDDQTRHHVNALPLDERLKLIESYDFIRRLIQPPFLPWEGITWVIDLLPNYPNKALDALDAFMTAHIQFLPDGRLHGLADAEAIVRRRYFQWANPREALLALRPGEFEFLTASLYEKMGYEVRVTQASRDGGVDVIAQRRDRGVREVALVQCKRYSDVVRVVAIRELMGVVARQQVNRGVLVTTSGFTTPAKQEADTNPMIELVDFEGLNELLNRFLGSKWPELISYEVRRMQRKHAGPTAQ